MWPRFWLVQFTLDQGPQLLRFDVLVQRLLEPPRQHFEVDLTQVDRLRRLTSLDVWLIANRNTLKIRKKTTDGHG